MDSVLSDLRAALRTMASRPGATAVIILSMALGIGANVGVFSVVNAVLVRPLPYRDPGTLVWITNAIPRFNAEMASGADFLDWREQSRTLASLAAFTSGANLTLAGREEPERVAAASVSASFFSTLGIGPAQGRVFEATDERLNAAPVAMVTHGLWLRLFSSEARLETQTITLDDRPHTIVGVLPPGFRLPDRVATDLLLPLRLDEARERGRHQVSLVRLVGRRIADLNVTAVRHELQMIRDRAEAEAFERVDVPSPPSPDGGVPGGGPGEPGMQIQIRRRPGLGRGAGGEPGPALGRGAARRGGPGPGPAGGPGARFGPPESRVIVAPLHGRLVGDVRPALLMLAGAVALVLLIASANVANLLLARATARHHELTVRAALGAGRGRLVRQLLTESVLLGLLGGAAGLLLAAWTVRGLAALVPPGLATELLREMPVTIDGPVLIFAMTMSVGTGLLFGIGPALVAARADLHDALKQGTRPSAVGSGRARARRLLVAAESALAVMLLVGAALLVRSLMRLQSVDPGFTPDRVLTFAIDLTRNRYPSPASRVGFFDELAQRARTVPGVEAVGYGDTLPLKDLRGMLVGLRVDGRELEPGQEPEVAFSVVSPDYFRTMGVQLKAGRTFSTTDDAEAVPVAIVNARMARHYWGSGDPIGRRLQMGPPDAPWITVVGVVADVRHDALDRDPRIVLYRPFAQQPLPFGFLAVRSALEPATLIGTVRQTVRGLDQRLVVYDVATMSERLSETVAPRTFSASLLALFAGVALLLAGVGLYGLLATLVTERTQEIGIRMALGAGAAAIVRMVLTHGLGAAAAGAAAGLLGAFALGRLLERSLFGVTRTDPVTFALVPVVLLVVAGAASALPAWRATRVDPIVALREE